MAQDYDVSVKLLFRHSHGLVARRVFGDQAVVEWLNVEQPKVTNLRADLLARLADGSLRHIEVHARNEVDIARREAEYYLGFWRLLGEHVEQVMLYIGREPLRMTPRFVTSSMQFEFKILDIPEFDGEPLLASEDWGDNLLALLTRVDQERVLRRVEEQLRKLKGEERETAARLFVILSGIIGVARVVVERVSMIDIMENEVIGPAIRKGIREGEAKILKAMLESRFGPVPSDVLAKLGGASDEEMMGWANRLLAAKSLSEVFAD